MIKEITVLIIGVVIGVILTVFLGWCLIMTFITEGGQSLDRKIKNVEQNQSLPFLCKLHLHSWEYLPKSGDYHCLSVRFCKNCGYWQYKCNRTGEWFHANIFTDEQMERLNKYIKEHMLCRKN